jgi:hypothetical protein
MKKLTAILLGCSLTVFAALAAEPSAADQKWLETVEKMVTGGEKRVSTPSEERVNLLKEWGTKKGYALKVTKTERGYSVEVTGKEAAGGIARK